MKKLFLLFVLTLITMSCAVVKQENKVDKFEQKLTAKVGKMTQDIKQEYGEPTKYSNISPLDVDDIGGFMIYDYRNNNDDCVMVFKYSKKTLKILDWNYSGDCFDR